MEKLRKKIRNILKEMFLIKEIDIKERGPASYQEFDMGSEFQYGFKTENKNIYYLSLKETILNIDNKYLLGNFESFVSDKGVLDNFYAVNFYSSEKNPNDSESFKQITNKDEPLLILSNLIWLINKFCETHNKNRIMFSAEPKRMRLYQNVFNNFKIKFHVIGPNKFDSSYNYDQILMFKK